MMADIDIEKSMVDRLARNRTEDIPPPLALLRDEGEGGNSGSIPFIQLSRRQDSALDAAGIHFINGFKAFTPCFRPEVAYSGKVIRSWTLALLP